MAEQNSRVPGPLSDDDAWYVALRWQQYDGEYRANCLRILSIGSFYLVHLLQYYQPLGFFAEAEKPSPVFHTAVTMLAAAWLFMALAVELLLRRQIFPKWIAYVTTGADLLLLTCVLVLGGGQQSPLVLAYVLILIMCSLRVSLRLIRTATLAAMFGYLYLMAIGKWPDLIGGRSIGVVPRYAQVMTLLGIGISGIMLGQLIRRFHGMARYYAGRRGVEVATDA